MSGQQNADPAFLNNIPTTIKVTSTTTTFSTVDPTSAVSSVSSTSATKTSGTATASTIKPTATSTPSSADIAQQYPNGLYLYHPSTPLAILFTVAHFVHVGHHFYLAIFVPHIQKCVNRKHSYTIPLFIAAVLFWLGYMTRAISIQPAHYFSLTLFAVSECLIILGPIFMCATLYMLIAHLIDFCLPTGRSQTFLGMSPKILGKVFIASDVLSFLLQCAGTGIMVGNNWQGPAADTGTNILIFGLATQLATFTLFLIVLLLFGKRVNQGGEKASPDEKEPISPNTTQPNWIHSRSFGMNPLVREVTRGMWIAGVLIEIRSIYRVVEFTMGDKGYPFNHEWMLWVFEAVPMWFTLGALGWYHPVKLLQQRSRTHFIDKHNGKPGDR